MKFSSQIFVFWYNKKTWKEVLFALCFCLLEHSDPVWGEEGGAVHVLDTGCRCWVQQQRRCCGDRSTLVFYYYSRTQDLTYCIPQRSKRVLKMHACCWLNWSCAFPTPPTCQGGKTNNLREDERCRSVTFVLCWNSLWHAGKQTNEQPCAYTLGVISATNPLLNILYNINIIIKYLALFPKKKILTIAQLQIYCTWNMMMFQSITNI